MWVVIGICAWLLFRWLRRIDWTPYTPQQIEDEPEPTKPDAISRAQAERLERLNAELDLIIEASRAEEKALLAELPGASDKRKAAIRAKLTGLAKSRAAVMRQIVNNENRIDKLTAEA